MIKGAAKVKPDSGLSAIKFLALLRTYRGWLTLLH
jgi:hypothetical protein